MVKLRRHSMRSTLIVVGLALAIGGGVLFSGLIQLGSNDEVLRVGDKALEIGDGGIRIADRGDNNRTLGIVLMVVGGVAFLVGALRKR
jgi:hypothetical protein